MYSIVRLCRDKPASSKCNAHRYRHLAKNAREAVGVYASNIHGIGLFCKREISAGEMVSLVNCSSFISLSYSLALSTNVSLGEMVSECFSPSLSYSRSLSTIYLTFLFFIFFLSIYLFIIGY